MKTRVTRYCDVCESVLKKLRPASHVASGTSYNGEYLSWNECSFHGEFQNHLNIQRTEKQSFESWFLEHGFDYNTRTGQADFPAKNKPKKSCPRQNINLETKSVIEDMLKKWGGTTK